jgi:LysM repeat protein
MPAAAKIHNAQLDTMCLKRGLSMKTISMGLDWEIEEIKTLNPIYKTEYIPASIKNRCVTGPLEKITLLVGMEDSLYALEHPSLILPPIETNVPEDSLANEPLHPDSLSLQYIYHKVKSGETLKSISTKYSITTEEIMEWNALQTSNIYVGQRLTLKKTHTVKAEVVAVVKPVVKPKKYYVVKAGDTLSQIAARQHVSLAQLKKLNPAAARGVIHPGDRLRIK